MRTDRRKECCKNRIAARRIAALLMILTMLSVCAGRESGSGNDSADPDTDGRSVVSADEEPAAEEAPDTPQSPPINYLVLVDRSHPLPDGWEENLQLVTTVNSVGDEVRVEKTAYNMYLLLKWFLERKGIHVELDSAYRSVEEQRQIVDYFTEKYGADYARTYAAVPGYSEHHTGLALDLYLIVDGVTVYENEDLVQYPEIWAQIHEMLPRFGFILRYPESGRGGYPYEPWHIRYVGLEPAKEITERGITLEEYLGER